MNHKIKYMIMNHSFLILLLISTILKSISTRFLKIKKIMKHAGQENDFSKINCDSSNEIEMGFDFM